MLALATFYAALELGHMANRILVSSTCYDLIDIRAELEAEIRSLGLHPVLSERPTSEFEVAPEADSITSCLANVDSADVVLVIFNQRYGPSLGERGFDDVSATHLEARRAREKGKTIYYFARQLFMADRDLVKAGAGNKCRWVRGGHDQRLVAFFDEIMPLQKDGPNNWFDVFTDSVDLRSLVRRRLGGLSLRTQVVEMINQQKLPNLLCWIPLLPSALNGLMSGVELRLRASRGDIHDLVVWVEGGARTKLGFLANGLDTVYKFNGFDKSEVNLGMAYSTIEGHQIEDTWTALLSHAGTYVRLNDRSVTPGTKSRIRILDPDLQG